MQQLIEYSNHPAVLFLAVVAFAWIWEDASLISAALLAADNKLAIAPAVMAVFLGISSGDLALYYLGRLALRWRRLRAWILTNSRSRALRRYFRQRTITNIIIIRFVPGLRALGFTLCGLWQIGLLRFLVAMVTAGVLWIALVFTIIFRLGTSEALQDSPWKWLLIGVALVLLLLNNVWAYYSHKSSTEA